jgi:hypothetical protein
MVSRSGAPVAAAVTLVTTILTAGVASCGSPDEEDDSTRSRRGSPPSSTDPASDPGDPSGIVDGTVDGTVGGADGGVDNTGGAGGAGVSDPGGTTDPTGGSGPLDGYWVWEQRVHGTEVQTGNIDRGQMKLAFGDGNSACHYIWNETTGSDFHTDCNYSVDGDMVTFEASADPDETAAGYSCAHPDWTSWNDRPATQWGRYRIVGDRLWIGVNTYWGFGGGVGSVPSNGSLKRFPFWESEGQASTTESWIVFKPVTRDEWYSTYAISTRCQGSEEVCAQWPGCGAGDKAYVD